MPCWNPTRETRAVLAVAMKAKLPFAVEVPMWSEHIDLVQERDGELHCYEFKYNNPSLCVHQAYRHQIYAKKSWVVLPKNSRRALEMCKQYGLGFATFTDGGEMKEVLCPVGHPYLKTWEPAAEKLRQQFDKMKQGHGT